MRYTITHQTSYAYDTAVSVSHHLVRLTPRDLPRQRCWAHQVEITPSATHTVLRTDYFGNTAQFVTVEGAHSHLVITARSTVEVDSGARSAPAETPPWESVREATSGASVTPGLPAVEFVFDSPFLQRRAAFAEYAAGSFTKERPILEAVLDFTDRIFHEFKFDPQATTVATPVERVLQEKRGVCQDFAHLQIACLRSLGLPARYVSGYLETLPPPGQPKLAGSDASHAWVAFFCPPYGWIDVDPTNNLLPSDRHVTVAWGRDFHDVSPIRGVLVGSGKHTLKVAVDVVPE